MFVRLLMRSWIGGALVALSVLSSLSLEPARAETGRPVITREVPYQHNGVELQGFLAQPKDHQGPLPGVLLVHEWWGHNAYVQSRAKQYAALGFVSFALDMYGKGILTADPSKASSLSKPFYEDRDLFRSRVQSGLKELLSNPQVDRNRIAVLGYCFGGTGALELARSGANIRGAISFHGGLSSPKPAIPGTVKARVLVLNGAEDPMVSPEERKNFMDEMRTAGVDWQFVEFGGAVHAFTNKEADSLKIPGVAYQALADQRSFEMSKDFLREVLR